MSNYRRPRARVFINNRQVQIPNTPGAINLAQQFGQPISGGTIKVVNPPETIKIKMPVVVQWSTGGSWLAAFQGFVVNPQRSAYPRVWNIAVKDVLWLADFAVQAETTINLGNNKSANECLLILLRDWAGIPESRIQIPPIETAPGEPWILGTQTPIAWQGMSPLQAAQQICTPLGLWLFADAGGIVRTVQISGAPSGSPARTFTEGQDLLISGAPELEQNADSIYNRVIVTGAPVGIGGATIKDAWQVEHDLLPDGKYREMTYSNPLIEQLNEADGGAASCTAIAKRLIAEYSRTPATIRARIKADPYLTVGNTVAIQSERIGYSTPANFFLYALSTSYGGGQFDQSLTLDGGIGPDGYTTIPPPLAAFSYRLHRENLDGTDTIEVFTDGTASRSLGGGEIASYSWSDNSSPVQTATGPRATFLYPASQTSTEITLEVTDTNGKTATTTQTIDLRGDLDGPPTQRALNFAAGLAWHVTPDGGQTWRTERGQDALAVPPIGAAGSSYADPGQAQEVGLITTGGASGSGTAGRTIRKTPDYLATASTTLGTLPGPISFLWQNEKTASRLWATVGDSVYLSIDGGASWSKKGTPATGQAVSWIVEAFDQEGTLDVLAGRSAYVSFDAGKTYAQQLDGPIGSTARALASGHDRHWVGFTNCPTAASPLRSYEGDVAAFPAVSPEVLSIRALTVLVDEPTLIAFDDVGRIWRVSAEDGSQATQIATMPDSDTPHHAIRDGDYPIIYVAGSRGLYKLFYQTGQIELMKSCAIDEQGHMVGYAGLVNPVAGYELILLPLAASGEADRIWHFRPDTGWLGKTPPIAGRRWRGIAVARANPARWLIWGDAHPSNSSGPSFTSRAGFIVGVGDYQPAFWLSEDSGASWSAYNVPSTVSASMDTHTQKDELINDIFATFTTGTDQIAITASTTGGTFDQFDRPLTSVVIWRDAAPIWSSPALLRGGHPTGFSAGQDDDLLMAGIFNTGGGGATQYRFGYVPSGGTTWQQVGSDYDDGQPTNYTGEYALNFQVEPGSRRAAAIQAHALGPQTGTLLTSDYRSQMFSPGQPASARLQNTDPTGIAFGKKGIYTTGAHDLSTGGGLHNNGLLHTTPDGTTSTELHMSYNRLTGITAARQRTQTTVAARLDGSPKTTPARFAVFTGEGWTVIDGPTAAPGDKLAEQIAVIER